MARWSEDTTIKFVREYVKHYCLWDVRDGSYKNKEARQAAYSEIQNAMNIEGFGHKEIVQKIKNIRSTYSQELRKIKISKKSGIATKDIYTPNIKWFNLLDGKLQMVEEFTRPTQTNLDNDNQENYPEVSVQPSQQPNSSGPNPSSQNPPKRKKIQDLSSVLHQIKELYTTINSNATNTQSNESEFDIFGRHIAAQLKALPFPMALEAQQHIQIYLNQYRLSQYRQHSAVQNVDPHLHAPPRSPSIHNMTNISQVSTNDSCTELYDESGNNEILVVKQEEGLDILSQAINKDYF